MRSVRGVIVLAVAFATAAQAEEFTTYGFGPRAAAMAGAMVADASDYTGTFYNPALLVNRTDVNFGASVNWYRTFTEVTSNDATRPIDCTYCQPPDAVGMSLGALFPLGGKVKNRVAIGLGLYIPFERLLRVLAPSTNQPFWYTFNSHNERLIIYLGLGVKIVDWLTVGIGAQALADLVGQGAKVKVDLFSKAVEAQVIDAHLAAHVAPVFGLQVKPIPRLRFGLTYHYEMSLKYSIPASIDLDGIGSLAFEAHGYTHYSPHSFVLGAAFEPHPDLTVALDAEFALWEFAPSPYLGMTMDLSGETLEALGLGSALDLAQDPPKPGFTNTLGVKLGLEYRLSKRFALRGGFFYRPTPVPKQDAEGTNVLDGSTLAATLGGGFNFDDPLEIFQSPIHIDLSVQTQFMIGREAKKDPLDTMPSYSYVGRTFGVSSALRYDF